MPSLDDLRPKKKLTKTEAYMEVCDLMVDVMTDLRMDLKKNRRKLNMTQEQVAANVGRARQWAMAMETGYSGKDERVLPKIETLMAYALGMNRRLKITTVAIRPDRSAGGKA